MERFILRQNIAIFQRAMDRETDAAERRIVQQMLADATAELARLDALADEPPGLGGLWSAAPKIPHYGTRAARPERGFSSCAKEIITGPQK